MSAYTDRDFQKWYDTKGWWVSRKFNLTEEQMKELWHEIRGNGY